MGNYRICCGFIKNDGNFHTTFTMNIPDVVLFFNQLGNALQLKFLY